MCFSKMLADLFRQGDLALATAVSVATGDPSAAFPSEDLAGPTAIARVHRASSGLRWPAANHGVTNDPQVLLSEKIGPAGAFAIMRS